MDEGVKLTRPTARRVFEATRYVEQLKRLPVPALSTAVEYGGTVMMHVTTACNGMSGASPGLNGRGRIQQFNGTSYSDFSTTAYPFINDNSNTIAIGSYVLCAPGPGGIYHIIMLDKCSNATGGS